jgi:arsenate reductase
MITTTTNVFPEIQDLIKTLELTTISDDRKKILNPLTKYIQTKITSNLPVRLNFICTHNSRRSHLSQVWAQTIASYFGIKNVFSYSGGTEATALFPMAASTLEKSGFQINTLSEGKNPVYSIKYAANEAPIIGFSKTFDAPFNPQSDFAAIMTCSSADQGCPFIAGAEQRFPITFEDPKAFDNTPQQAEKYHERSVQIATELYYIFSKVKA